MLGLTEPHQCAKSARQASQGSVSGVQQAQSKRLAQDPLVTALLLQLQTLFSQVPAIFQAGCAIMHVCCHTVLVPMKIVFYSRLGPASVSFIRVNGRNDGR